MFKRSNFPLIPILCLVLISILAGFLMYKKGNKKPLPFPGQQNYTPNATVSGKIKSKNLPDLSASPTAQEYKDFLSFVDKNAKDTITLDLTKCDPNPKVARVKSDQEFSLVNKDSIEHGIILSGQTYTAPAGGSFKMKQKEIAGYRYTCFTPNSVAIEGAGYLEVVR